MPVGKSFVLIGAGGYIAPRHLEAIKAVGGNLVAALDANDSVGILDRYFPDTRFFTEIEKLEAWLKQSKTHVDFFSICSPNFLHSTHIQLAFRYGADAICEKPIVLTEKEIDMLEAAERKYGRRVYTILQLRVHDAIIALKKKIDSEPGKIHDVNLDYVTSRGHWYQESWKANVEKSGGLSTNIGVHFFDMLTWIFGAAKAVSLNKRTPTEEAGTLSLERANVRWDLSIAREALPPQCVKAGKTTFRSLKIDGAEFEFSEGFTELHNRVYNDILGGRGYGLEDARASIAIVEKLRTAKVEA
jgi:UDP-N-acetyl-2-amino-2-deoxyglucuronate dehydrogenase